jgi:hypothetical protein
MKYIFIDSNTYRHIFSENEGFSDDIKNILVSLIETKHIKLLLPQQVKDEVERNRYEEWYLNEKKDIEKKISKNNKEIEQYEESLKEHKKELKNIKKRIEGENNKLNTTKKSVETRYRGNRSKANQKLRVLFNKAETIKETPEILDHARLRLEKGNPPDDNKLGDALIWESLLYFLSTDKSKSSLIFIARDNNAWGKEGFNPWLKKELGEKTNTDIIFTKALSDIKDLTETERELIKQTEKEEQKKNALVDFLGVYGYINASVKLERLLIYKEYLTQEDYIQIIKEFLKNSSVINSYYTSWKVKTILSDQDSDYVVEKIENIKKEILDKVNNVYDIKLKRRQDDNDFDF